MYVDWCADTWYINQGNLCIYKQRIFGIYWQEKGVKADNDDDYRMSCGM